MSESSCLHTVSQGHGHSLWCVSPATLRNLGSDHNLSLPCAGYEAKGQASAVHWTSV